MSAFPGEFNRSTQHYSLERSGDVCHPLAALPALSGLCLQLRRETTSVHAPPYAYRSNVPDRVEGCCVDRLNPPPKPDILHCETTPSYRNFKGPLTGRQFCND